MNITQYLVQKRRLEEERLQRKSRKARKRTQKFHVPKVSHNKEHVDRSESRKSSNQHDITDHDKRVFNRYADGITLPSLFVSKDINVSRTAMPSNTSKDTKDTKDTTNKEMKQMKQFNKSWKNKQILVLNPNLRSNSKLDTISTIKQAIAKQPLHNVYESKSGYTFSNQNGRSEPVTWNHEWREMQKNLNTLEMNKLTMRKNIVQDTQNSVTKMEENPTIEKPRKFGPTIDMSKCTGREAPQKWISNGIGCPLAYDIKYPDNKIRGTPNFGKQTSRSQQSTVNCAEKKLTDLTYYPNYSNFMKNEPTAYMFVGETGRLIDNATGISITTDILNKKLNRELKSLKTLDQRIYSFTYKPWLISDPTSC